MSPESYWLLVKGSDGELCRAAYHERGNLLHEGARQMPNLLVHHVVDPYGVAVMLGMVGSTLVLEDGRKPTWL